MINGNTGAQQLKLAASPLYITKAKVTLLTRQSDEKKSQKVILKYSNKLILAFGFLKKTYKLIPLASKNNFQYLVMAIPTTLFFISFIHFLSVHICTFL